MNYSSKQTTPPPGKQPYHTLLTGMLVGLAGLLTIFAARFQLFRAIPFTRVKVVPDDASTEAWIEASTETPPDRLNPTAPQTATSPLRWLLFLGFALIVGLLLIILPGAAAQIIFLLTLTLALVTIVRGAVPIVWQFVLFVKRGLLPPLAAARLWVDQRRMPLSRWLAAGSLVLLAFSTLYFHLTRISQRTLEVPVALMLAGGLALGGALALRPALALLSFDRSRLRVVTGAGRVNRPLLIFALILLALVAEMSGDLFKLEFLQAGTFNAQMILLVSGLLLTALALGGFHVTISLDGLLALSRRAPALAWEIAILLVVMLLALGLRSWGLNDTVRGMIDEVNTIPEVRAFWGSQSNVRLLTQMNGISPFPWVFAYFQAAGVDVLGRNLAGLRIASGVTGMLTIPALYLLARALFDRRTALLAALLLATFPPHVHFSRLALLNIADPLIGVFALAFLARGMAHGRRLDFALGGIFLGLTQYFYNGGRLFYIPLAVTWIIGLVLLDLIFQRGRPPDRPNANGGGLKITLIALGIAIFPLYYTILARGELLVGRQDASMISVDYWKMLHDQGFLLPIYLGQLGWALRFYVQNPDDTAYYGGETALVLPWLVPLFLVGMFYSLWRWHRPGPLLLLLWLAATAVGNSLLIMPAASTRFVIAFPLLALLLAVGLRYGLPLLFEQVVARRAALIIPLLAVICAVGQVAYYFGPHLTFYQVQMRAHKNMPDGWDAILRSLDFPAGTRLHIISSPAFNLMDGWAVLSFFTDNLTINTFAPDDLTDKYLRTLPCNIDHAFYIQPRDAATYQKLRQYFYLRPPVLTDNPDVPPNKELVLFYAPALPGSGAFYGRDC